jgi:hypothetical protein
MNFFRYRRPSLGDKGRNKGAGEFFPALANGRDEVYEGRFVPTTGRMILPGETRPRQPRRKKSPVAKKRA